MQISNLEHLQIANLEEVKGGSFGAQPHFLRPQPYFFPQPQNVLKVTSIVNKQNLNVTQYAESDATSLDLGSGGGGFYPPIGGDGNTSSKSSAINALKLSISNG